MRDSVNPIHGETPRPPGSPSVAGQKLQGLADRPPAPKSAEGPSVHDVARVMTDRGGGHPAVAATLLAQGAEGEQSLAMLGDVGDDVPPRELALAAQAMAELDVARQDVEDNAAADDAAAAHIAEAGALSRSYADEETNPAPRAPGAS
jgi:hypothetical protein